MSITARNTPRPSGTNRYLTPGDLGPADRDSIPELLRHNRVSLIALGGLIVLIVWMFVRP